MLSFISFAFTTLTTSRRRRRWVLGPASDSRIGALIQAPLAGWECVKSFDLQLGSMMSGVAGADGN